MLRYFLIGILGVSAAIVGALTFDWYRDQHTATIKTATLKAATLKFGAPFQLIDDDGREITEATFMDSPSALFFGFTHCPEVCPTTLFEMDGWLKQLGDTGASINAYFITVDPERDTPEIMAAYVNNVSDRIVGISGEPEKVHEMARSFHIYWKKMPLEGGDYTIDHSASIMLLDRSGDFFGTIAYGEDSEAAIAKLKRLAAS